MADSVIGALRVILGVDTAAFSAGMKGAEKQLASFSKNVAGASAVAGVAIATAAAVIGTSVAHMINEADNLGKASQKFGVPVEQLSALKFAAELADVSFESLGKGLGKLSRAMLDGITNPAGDAAKSFAALGISVKDSSGNLRSTEAVFGDVAEKFSNMEDGAAKTALAIRIFGKSGADLIPLLNEGRNGIKKLTDEARELGIVISKETAAKAQEFNDTLKRLGAVKDSIILKITEGMLPGLQRLASALVQTGKDTDTLRTAGASIIDGFNTLVHTVFAVALGFNRLSIEWQRLNEVASTLPFTEARRQATERYNAAIAETKQKFLDLRAAFSAPDPDALAWMGAPDAAKGKKNLEGYNQAALGAKSAIDSFISSQQKSEAATKADIAANNAWIGTREGMRITLEAEAIALSNNITLTDKQRIALKALADQAAANAVLLAGIAVTQQNLTPFELYQQELQKINQLYAEQAISADTASRAGLKAAAALTEAYGSAAATAAGQFSEFFKTFGKGNKEMFLISKAFSISQAIINTFVGATKAIATLPPPLGQIAAAATIAFGLAQVAKIAAEKPPALAMGGSFMVPGGSTSVDSRLVPMLLSPGERVDVTPASKVGAGGSRELVIPAIKPRDFFTGETVREMVIAIDQWQRDGGTGMRFAQ